MKKRNKNLLMACVLLILMTITICDISGFEDMTKCKIKESAENDTSNKTPPQEMHNETEISETIPENNQNNTDNTKDKENQKQESNVYDTFKEIEEIVYITFSVNIRKGPGVEYETIDFLNTGEPVIRIGTENNSDWSKIIYKEKEGYIPSNYLSVTKPIGITDASYPLTYLDETCKITIYKEWYKNAWCYAAHLEFSDYDRLKTASANENYGSYETTSHAANRLNAILCVNGDHANGKDNCGIVRAMNIVVDGKNDSCGFYNSNTGKFHITETTDTAGVPLSTLVADKKLTDTLTFVKPYLINGQIVNYYGNSRAQRTFIGTNENPGDIWLVVSDGRYNDGESAGLTYHECAEYLKSKGCTQGTALDGGGSSTMVWKGNILNASQSNERVVIDFIYFK